MVFSFVDQPLFFSNKEAFMEDSRGFGLKEEDANLGKDSSNPFSKRKLLNSKINAVFKSIVKELGVKEKVEKWSEFLGRPNNKWGNDPLEKAALQFLKNEHFLAVKHLRVTLYYVYLS